MTTGTYDLTRGSILRKLLQVAVPIMGTQLMQMAYNLTCSGWTHGKLKPPWLPAGWRACSCGWAWR